MLNLKHGYIYGIDGNDYFFERKVRDGFLMRSADAPNVTSHIDEAELAEILARGMLSVRPPPRSPKTTPLPDNGLAGESLRRRLCETFLDAEMLGVAWRTDRSMQVAIAAIIESNPVLGGAVGPLHGPSGARASNPLPTPGQLRRWLRTHEAGLPTRPFPPT